MAEKRPQLISDIIWWLQGEKKSTLRSGSLDRWATWQRAILERFDNADEVAESYQSKRPEVDSDLEEAEELANCISNLVSRRGLDPMKDAIRISRRVLYQELRDKDVIDGSMSPKGSTTWIKNLVTLDPLKTLQVSKHTGSGRAWVWYGADYDGKSDVVDIDMMPDGGDFPI